MSRELHDSDVTIITFMLQVDVPDGMEQEGKDILSQRIAALLKDGKLQAHMFEEGEPGLAENVPPELLARWRADQADVEPVRRRVRVSFDVIAYRSGSAELSVPTDSSDEYIQELLYDRLNRSGDALRVELMPDGVTMHDWDIQPPRSLQLETDWVEEVGDG